MKSQWIPRILFLVIIISIIITFKIWDFEKYLTLDYLKSQQQTFLNFYEVQPIKTILIFMSLYILMTGLSLPGSIMLSLTAGALFGLWMGTLLVSFACTIGATLAFLSSRYVLHDFIQNKFKRQIKRINQGIEEEGTFYLFSLRLFPASPYVVINLVMGITPISVFKFYWVSQIGLLPGNFIYVNAGTQLAKVDTVAGILTPELLFSLVLIGLLPFVSKWLAKIIKTYHHKTAT